MALFWENNLRELALTGLVRNEVCTGLCRGSQTKRRAMVYDGVWWWLRNQCMCVTEREELLETMDDLGTSIGHTETKSTE